MKRYVIAAIFAFCLIMTLFLAIPTRSIPTVGEYDPWADINDDGTIDIKDVSYVARLFGTDGEAINKTELLLGLQAQIDSLNASLIDLINQTRNIYEVEIKAYCPIEDKDLSVEIAKNGIASAFNTTHTFAMIGDNAFTVPLNGPNNHNFTHWNIGSTNTTITVSSSGVYTAYYESSPTGDWFNGLLGYWKLDEGTGTSAFDSSGNGNNGTLVNNPTWIDGRYGKALSLDGTDDYAAIPDLCLTIPTELTVSAWVNSSLDQYDTPVIHCCKNGEFELKVLSPGIVSFLVKLASSGTYEALSSVTQNAFHQLTGTWTKGESIRLYVDGVLVNEISVPDQDLYSANLFSAIGCRYGGSFFNGTIDEVIVYKRALSEEEVLAHYVLPPP
jgi:hypothetical protein